VQRGVHVRHHISETMLIPQNVQRRRAGALNHGQLAAASALTRNDFERDNAYHRALAAPLFQTGYMERLSQAERSEKEVIDAILGIHDVITTVDYTTTSYPAFSSAGSMASGALFADIHRGAHANARPSAPQSTANNSVAASKMVVSSPTNSSAPKTKKRNRGRRPASSAIRAASLAKDSSGNVVEELNRAAINKPSKKRRGKGKAKGRMHSKKKGATVPGEASRPAACDGAAGASGQGSGVKSSSPAPPSGSAKLRRSVAMRLLFGEKTKSATASDVTEQQVAATSSKVPTSQQMRLDQQVQRKETTTKSRKRSREQGKEAGAEKARKVPKMLSRLF
jgi:hypothetical protein